MSTVHRLAAGAADRLVAGIGRRRLAAHGVTHGPGLVLRGLPIVSVADGSTLALGARVVLCSRSTWTALGVAHPVMLRTLRPGASLVVGDDVGISGGALCAATSVSIGAGTLLGADVTVTDTDFHPPDSSARRRAPLPESRPEDRVLIGRNVFIGAGTRVLKGATIGDHAVIGAGSVVTGDVPSGYVAAGVPCRILRPLILDDPAIRAPAPDPAGVPPAGGAR